MSFSVDVLATGDHGVRADHQLRLENTLVQSSEPPFSRLSSIRRAAAPIACRSPRRVVSAGVTSLASRMSSAPVTATSSGTAPQFRTGTSTPMATRSLWQTSPSTSGRHVDSARGGSRLRRRAFTAHLPGRVGVMGRCHRLGKTTGAFAAAVRPQGPATTPIRRRPVAGGAHHAAAPAASSTHTSPLPVGAVDQYDGSCRRAGRRASFQADASCTRRHRRRRAARGFGAGLLRGPGLRRNYTGGRCIRLLGPVIGAAVDVGKDRLAISGTISPMVRVCRVARPRAMLLGR